MKRVTPGAVLLAIGNPYRDTEIWFLRSNIHSDFEINTSQNRNEQQILVDLQALKEKKTGNFSLIKAKVNKNTESYVKLIFSNGKEVWFLKSTIHSVLDFNTGQNGKAQIILVETWILNLKREEFKSDLK